MPITTRTELKDALATWFGRDTNDATDPIVANADTFISLAETRFSHRLRVAQLMRRAIAKLNEAVEFLPFNLVAIHTISYQSTAGAWHPLQYVTPRQLRAGYSTAGSPPYVYTLVGHEILFGPFVETAQDELTSPCFEVIYWSKPVALSASQQTNEILEHYPEIYLYGAAVEAARYLVSDQLPDFQQALSEAIAVANDRAETEVIEGMQLTPGDWAP